MTPPKVQLKAPVVSAEGLSVSWDFSEEASTICELHSPSMPNVTTIPCLKNTVLLTHSQEGYSLFILGTDMKGNEAEPVQLTWSIGKIVTNEISLKHTYIHHAGIMHTYTHTRTDKHAEYTHIVYINLGILKLGFLHYSKSSDLKSTVLCVLL